MFKKILILFITFFCFNLSLTAEDGYRLWLRYDKIENEEVLAAYKAKISGFYIYGKSKTLDISREELSQGLSGLLGEDIPEASGLLANTIVVGTIDNIPSMKNYETQSLGNEGFYITHTVINHMEVILITANTDIGILYGVFNFLKLLQTNQSIDQLSIENSPKVKLRVLNHWDNLDRTVERGYAGFSLWDWHRLPGYIDERYNDYARANASIGINGTVLTNVNANALVLTPHYLEKVKALADIFRPYGIRVYLTARFSAPIEIGVLQTADPKNPDVQNWWNEKVKEIYSHIPDFGGFLVKANSEGQPGPQNYGRSHAEGANMLADALEPFGGVVMWRAFVYSNEEPEDRAKQAFNEFKPLDGKFRDNVLIQVKNGPIDFQPREPFHPMFGAMPETPLMIEFQITQEYLGQATHLVYLATLYEETLNSDTYAKGKGSTVAKVIDGSLHDYSITGMAGVSNIGTDRNWTGHLFGQANWYAFGRMAWNPELPAEQIAGEWIKMTFKNDQELLKTISDMMMASRDIVVDYMTPLGLHHLMGWDHHYGPAPWITDKHRADWTSVYYHRADSEGIGFDRTSTGSNAVEQYFSPVEQRFGSLKECSEKYLLWFHHVPWNYKMDSGKTLWEELCFKYSNGVDSVQWLIDSWSKLEAKIDKERYDQVKMLLNIQEKEAVWWKDANLLYFQSFSQMPFPITIYKPAKTLEYYKGLKFPYAPGIKPKW